MVCYAISDEIPLQSSFLCSALPTPGFFEAYGRLAGTGYKRILSTL